MPKYTLELEYLMPISCVVVVEAENAEQAVERAMDECDWSDCNEWREASTTIYVEGMALGDHGEARCGNDFPGDACIPVPVRHAKRAVLERALSAETFNDLMSQED